MNLLRRLSIRNKLIGITLLTTASSLLAGFAFVIANDVRTFRADSIEGSVLMARVVGDHSVGALAFGDRAEGGRILARLEAVPGIEAAHLYDTSGALFAAFSRSAIPDAPPPPSESLRELREGRLHVFEPIVRGNEHYGTIHLVASTRQLSAKIRRYLAVMLSLLLGLLLLSIGFAVRLQRIISEPILRLADAARWISQAHDYSFRVEKSGADEIGDLCDGFNDMLSELGRKNAELQEKSARLEALYRQEREATRTLQELNEMKTNFLVVTSHELRTPLTVIRGYTEALLAGVVGSMTERQRESLEACQRMVFRMVETLVNIQQMLEINEGLVAARGTAVVDLREIARGMLAELHPFIEQRGLEVSLEAREALPVTGDALKLEFVLVNLIQNAIKFTQDGGRVRVTLQREEGAAHVTIEDNGIGIEAAEIGRIFEGFYTSQDSLGHHRSGKFQFEARGPGLGLAIAKSYVEAHGGRMWAESEGRGHGSRFHVLLPAMGSGDGTGIVATGGAAS